MPSIAAAMLAALLPVCWQAPRAAGQEPDFVIPPAQEQLLADMLGLGVALPGGCRFTDGAAAGPAATATYSCDGGEVVVRLGHPSAAPTPAARTERFAVTVVEGTAPPQLIDVLAARVREREGTFTWSQPPPPPTPVPVSGPGDSGSAGSGGMLGVIAAGAAVAIALGLLWRSRVGRTARRWCTARAAAARGSVSAWTAATRRVARDAAENPRDAARALLRDERFWALAILLLSAALRGWMSVINRSSNDDHAVVASMIRQAGWLPPDGAACMECSHAKLYHYVLAVAFELIAGGGEVARMLGNLLNWLAGTLLLALFYVFARRLRCSPTVRLLGLAFMSFNGAVVGIFSQTTNDGFVILFSSLAIFFLDRFLAQRRTASIVAATAGVVLAALSKASGWAVFAAGSAVLGVAYVAAGAALRRQLLTGAGVFVLGFLAVVPWLHPYAQNIARAGTPFVNDAFATPVMTLEVPRAASWPAEFFLTFRIVELVREPYLEYGPGPHAAHRESLWSQLYGRMMWVRFDRGIWANRDPSLTMFGRLCMLVGLLPLAALVIGTAQVALAAVRGVVRQGLGWLSQERDWQHLIYVGVVLASLIAVLIEYHRLEWLFIWMKAIYLFPVILSLFALFLIGLECLWQRWPRLVRGWMLSAIAVSLVDLAWLLHDLTRGLTQ